MMRLTKENVLFLYRLMVDRIGGGYGVRDEGLLESAIESAYSGFGDVEFYPGIEEKATRLGFSLISNHPFIDGNKRIGVFVMLVFLELHGIVIECSEDELVRITMSVADGRCGYDDLLGWVNSVKK